MKRWLLPSLVALLVVGAAAAFTISWLGAPDPDHRPAGPAAPETVTVERTDLVDEATFTGTIAYGTASTLTGQKSGTLTWLPEPGRVVQRGETLYKVDARPVPLLYGKTPLYRKLKKGVATGPDVVELIDNLAALGYPISAGHKRYDDATVNAVKQFQRDHGLPRTGELDVGDVVMLPGKIRVKSVRAQLGADAQAEVLDYTSVTKSVTAKVNPQQVDIGGLKPKAKVDLTLPDGAKTTGTVTTVSEDSSSDDSDSAGLGGGGPQVAITITFDHPSAVAKINSGNVEVRAVIEHRKDVLAVPVTALLALAEGGYAVQVVRDDGTTKLVGVELGMFADQLVEVSGDGLEEGMRVVRAS